MWNRKSSGSSSFHVLIKRPVLITQDQLVTILTQQPPINLSLTPGVIKYSGQRGKYVNFMVMDVSRCELTTKAIKS